jgi:hypothetical protein
MTVPAKSLKAQNVPWLWSVVVADAVALTLYVTQGQSTQNLSTHYGAVRAIVTAVAPIVVLLLTPLFSADVKTTLVFWRIRHALPGHRAFSVYARRDSRIDLVALKKKIGEFQRSPREQNAKLYGLYKEVESQIAVTQAHRHYLLFRDLAALSLLPVPVAALLVDFLGGSKTAIVVAAGSLIGQYATAAIAARNSGVRLVTNVLALETA